MDSNSHLIAHGQGRRARHVLIGGCVLLLATGVAWLIGHDVWLQQTPFGPQPHPLVAWLLRAHGAIAWGVTLVGGVVWQVHVRPAWRAVRRRRLHRRRVEGARTGRARVIRKRQPVYDGGLSTLRRFQDDVKEVRSGLECGIKLGDFSEYQVGDVIECYQLEQIAQKL